MKLTQFAFMILLWPADIVHLEHSDDIMISTFICCHVLIINFGVFSASSHKILSQRIWCEACVRQGKQKHVYPPPLGAISFWLKLLN